MLSRDDKLGLAGHLGVNVGSLLLGLPAVSGVPELLVALGRWHGRTIPEDRDAALRAAAKTLGGGERDVLNAELLLDHAGVDLDWIADHAHGRPGGIEGEVDHLLAHVRAEAAHSERGLSGWKFDHADYEPAFRAIALTYRRLFAQPGFLDAMRHELGRASAARERRIEGRFDNVEAMLAQLVEAQQNRDELDRLRADAADKDRRIDELRRALNDLEAQRERGGSGDDAFDHAVDDAFARADPAAVVPALLRRHRARMRRASEASLADLRNAAAIAYWTDTTAALEAYREITALAPEDVGAWIERGRLAIRFGRLDEAETAARTAETTAEQAGDERRQAVACHDLGVVRQALGDLAGAEAAFKEYERSCAARAERDPSNTGWQRDLSVSHEKIGNVRVARGELADALAAYEAVRAIAERLAAMARTAS